MQVLSSLMFYKPTIYKTGTVPIVHKDEKKEKKIRQIDSFLKRIFLKVVCNSKPNAYIYIFSHFKIQMSHHYHYLETSLQAFLFTNFLLQSTSVYSIISQGRILRCNIDFKSRSSKKMCKKNFSNLEHFFLNAYQNNF